MGEIMDRATVVKVLQGNNIGAAQDKIVMYTDAYMDYVEAAQNIQQQGAIVAHPKTGAPIDNPYIKIRLQMMAVLRKIRLNADGLW